MQLDHELVSESYRLASRLQRFEATCTEPGYQVRVSHLAHGLRSYGSQSESTDGWVRQVGKGFQMADWGWSTPLPMPDSAAGAAGPLREWRARIASTINLLPTLRVPDWLEYARPAVAGVLIAACIRPGSAYAGQVIINLPDVLGKFVRLREVREWAGLSPYLNHVKYTNIPSHFLKIGLLTSVPVIASKWATDVQRYGGTELASAMAVDAALTLAPVGVSFLSSQGGMALGAAIGTLLFPGVGTVAGGALGAILGGVAGQIATQWAIDHYGVRDEAIGWVDTKIARPAAEAVSKGVQGVEEKLKSTVDSIASAVGGGSSFVFPHLLNSEAR